MARGLVRHVVAYTQLGVARAAQQSISCPWHYRRTAGPNRPSTQGIKRMTITIELTGWKRVHTWQEPHGNGHDAVYQRETPRYDGKVQLLTVSKRNQGATGVRIELSSHDYLLAEIIRANVGGRYALTGECSISPCCTSGHNDWCDTITDDVYRVVSVAGHGSYAFPLSPMA